MDFRNPKRSIHRGSNQQKGLIPAAVESALLSCERYDGQDFSNSCSFALVRRVGSSLFQSDTAFPGMHTPALVLRMLRSVGIPVSSQSWPAIAHPNRINVYRVTCTYKADRRREKSLTALAMEGHSFQAPAA